MKLFEPGDPAPTVLLQDLANRTIQLSETWSQGSNTLLIFLRHLG